MADERISGWMRLSAGLLVAVLLALSPGCGNANTAAKPGTGEDEVGHAQSPQTQAVTINDYEFQLELALDDESRHQGLSDRKEIAEDGGMLFVFKSPRLAHFVMRRCYVPIDLIYLDDDGYVDSLHRMAVIEPVGGSRWTNPTIGYPSAGQVQFVIELKGGTLDKLKLRRGDQIELPFEALQSNAQ